MASRSTPSPGLYLTAGRLSDVLALIQILAYGEFAKRTHAGLAAQLRRSPFSADTWTEIGRQHPELFRVLEAERHQSQQETVALIARFLQPGIEAQSADEPPKSPPLLPDVTSKLMELAIQLHDREVQRRDWWKSILVPIVVAVITATAGLAGVLIGAYSKTAVESANRSSVRTTEEKIWQGFATQRSSGRIEAWWFWRANRDTCLRDMTFDISNSVQAQWYREPIGCFYVGSEKKFILYWVNRFYNTDAIECIATVKESTPGNRYVVLPKGSARETQAWRCE